MPAKFVIKKESPEEYFFYFLDPNDEIVLISGDYPDKKSAELAIKDVQLNSLMSQQLAGGKTKEGEMFFVIKGSDGHVIVKSALYTSQMKMDNALHCAKDNACIAEIEDQTTLAVA